MVWVSNRWHARAGRKSRARPPVISTTVTASCVTTSDGVAVAVHDLGGEGPPALLVHATGFHAHVLAPLAAELAGAFSCCAVDLRGHGDSGLPPGLRFDWRGFALDVHAALAAIRGVRGETGQRPVGIGHSCGGAALLLAEQAVPGTFSQLYLFEPVVPSPTAPDHDLESRQLAASTRQRRETFASREQAYDNYASKAPLNLLRHDVLRAYVDYGFEDLEDGTVRLKCRRSNEALVYENAYRHSAFEHLDEVRCPTTIACGSESDTLDASVLEPVSKRIGDGKGRLEVLGGLRHLGPLQRPDQVARSVVESTRTPGVAWRA